MRRREVHLAFLLFQAIWLNVIVPGHQRGVVQLPGASRLSRTVALTSGVGTCPRCAGEQEDRESKQSKSNSPRPTGSCAVCFFAAHLSVPPAIDLSLPPLRFLERLCSDVAEDHVARVVLMPFDGRAPPALG